MASLDKEIKVMMLKGSKGNSAYQEAVENQLFSGTLEEWIETFATPDDYITRKEFQKVTQAQYDALKEAGQLIPNCYYLIIDDTTYDDIEQAIEDLNEAINDPQTGLNKKIQDNKNDIDTIKPLLDKSQIIGSDEYRAYVTNDGDTIKLIAEKTNSEDDVTLQTFISVNYDEILLTFDTISEGERTNDLYVVIDRGQFTINKGSLDINLLEKQKLYRHDIELTGNGSGQQTYKNYGVYFTIYCTQSTTLSINDIVNNLGTLNSICASGWVDETLQSITKKYPITRIRIGFNNIDIFYIKTEDNVESTVDDITSTITDTITQIF